MRPPVSCPLQGVKYVNCFPLEAADERPLMVSYSPVVYEASRMQRYKYNEMSNTNHELAEYSDADAPAYKLSDRGTPGPTTPRATEGSDEGTDLDPLVQRIRLWTAHFRTTGPMRIRLWATHATQQSA